MTTPARPPVIRVGHKGASRLAPANTLAAVRAGHAAGVDAVELDVVRGRDGALALGHDEREAEERATPFGDALALLASPPFAGLRVLVDVKAREIEAPIVAALHAHDMAPRALVCAREPEVLEAVRHHDPALVRGWSLRWPWHAGLLPGASIWRGVAAAVGSAVREGAAEAIMLHHSLVTPATVAAIHDAGAPLYVWTVNDAARMQRLAALGADAIVTDDPRIFRLAFP